MPASTISEIRGGMGCIRMPPREAVAYSGCSDVLWRSEVVQPGSSVTPMSKFHWYSLSNRCTIFPL